MAAKLKPCPKCDGCTLTTTIAQHTVQKGAVRVTYGASTTIKCANSCTGQVVASTKKVALTAWNDRYLRIRERLSAETTEPADATPK